MCRNHTESVPQVEFQPMAPILIFPTELYDEGIPTGKPILIMESLPSFYHCIQELPHEIQYHLENRQRRARSLG